MSDTVGDDEREALAEANRKLSEAAFTALTLLHRANTAEADFADEKEETERLIVRAEAAEAQVTSLTARAVVAEHHKALELLSKGSAVEQLEMKLRTELAESQLQVEALTARVQQLETALRYHGVHVGSCPVQFGGGACTCGLDAALASAGRSTPPAEGHG